MIFGKNASPARVEQKPSTPNTRELFSRSAVVLGRPVRTEVTSLLAGCGFGQALPRFFSLFEGRPRTTALRQKSVRASSSKASVRRGRPRMASLRQKSVRASSSKASVRRGRPRTAALRLKSLRVLGVGASVRRGTGGFKMLS